MNEPIKQRSEAEEAAHIRQMAQKALQEIVEVMDYANRQGFVVGFNLGLDANIGRNRITNLTVARHY